MSILSGMLKKVAISALDRFLGTGNHGFVTLSCDGDSFVIPVDPETFDVSVSNGNSVVNVINLGELNMIGKTGLKAITIASFFPAQKYSFNNVGASTDPYAYVNRVEQWRTSGKACHIDVSGALSMDCLIQTFTYGEHDGSGDVYYKIDLKEYVDLSQNDLIDSLTGLKKQKDNLSWLQRTGATAVKKMLQGQSPMQAITGAVASSKLTPKQQGYLAVWETVSKHGGMNVGDAIETGLDYIKINGKNIYQMNASSTSEMERETSV